MTKSKRKSPLPPLYSHEELLKRLSAQMPAEALRTNADGQLDIVYAFQLERMNEVFGFGGWISEPEILSQGKSQTSEGVKWEVSVIVTLKIPRYGIVRRKPGACSMDVLDHALKGAVTSAEGKCFSTLGIAADVYKGLHGGFNGNSNGRSESVSPRTAHGIYLRALNDCWDMLQGEAHTEEEIGIRHRTTWEMTKAFDDEVESLKAGSAQ